MIWPSTGTLGMPVTAAGGPGSPEKDDIANDHGLLLSGFVWRGGQGAHELTRPSMDHGQLVPGFLQTAWLPRGYSQESREQQGGSEVTSTGIDRVDMEGALLEGVMQGVEDEA